MDVNAPHVHVECTRVYVCTPVSKSLLHAVQVHGRQGLHRVATQGRSPYGCGISLHVQAGRSPCEEGSLTQQCHHHLWAARPAPRSEPLPQVSGQEGAVLTRDCRMAWLVAFMQESSGKEHSPSQ